MNPSVQRAFRWVVLALASLVVIGVFLQVYFIAVYLFSGASDTDVLDLHENVGGIVHGVEVLTFLAAIPAFWKRWREVGLAFALAAIGTIQLAFTEGDEQWVRGFHGLLALVVLILAHAVASRTMRELGIGPRHRPEAPR